MKKLTLTVAVLLSATYLFAQNNNSVVNQNNNYSEAVIKQTGSDHSSDVLQTSNAANVGQLNKAKVTQKNYSTFDGNVAIVKEKGNSHKSTVEQEGANTLSSFIGSRVGDGPSTQDYGQNDANSGNETYAKQVGNGNVGAQSIFGSTSAGTYLELQQRGNLNTSTQLGAFATNSNGFVSQGIGGFGTSASNSAWQQIDGDAELASTIQLGTSNTATQWIQGGGSNGNESFLTQTGNLNWANTISNGDDNFFSGTQLGNSNMIKGLGDQWTAATQTGDDNSAILLQTGNSNTFSIAQTGDGNVIQGAVALEGLGAIQLGNSNSAKISQDGDGNLSQSRQKGSSNIIDLSQTGDDLSSIVSQYKGLFTSANSNTATITQTGSGHDSSVIQNGSFNVTTVTQNNAAR